MESVRALLVKYQDIFAQVLAYADFSKSFIVEVDARHGGLGAVFSQEHEGKVRPVAFARRGLRPTEQNMDNYSSMKLELLAVKWAVTKKFREYLLGAQFTILSDNNPLSYLHTAKLRTTEQRWTLQLPAFNFTIKYHPGRSNQMHEILAINFTILKPASDGGENVLIVTDVFTKYTQAIPTRDQRASMVAQVLIQHWFHLFGVPAQMHSDQGRNFESALNSYAKCMVSRRAGLLPITHKGMASVNASTGPWMTSCKPCHKDSLASSCAPVDLCL
ncbi:hypothetical protein AOLI_G00285950 [Acnodon oligacanthus]